MAKIAGDKMLTTGKDGRCCGDERRHGRTNEQEQRVCLCTEVSGANNESISGNADSKQGRSKRYERG